MRIARLSHCPNPQVVDHPRGGRFEVCVCPRDPQDWWAPVHWVDQWHGPMFCHCGPKWQDGDILIWDGNHYGYYCRECARRGDGGSGHLLAQDCVCCSCGGPALQDHGYRLYRHIPPSRTGAP